jgi:hypothetical protein
MKMTTLIAIMLIHSTPNLSPAWYLAVFILCLDGK